MDPNQNWKKYDLTQREKIVFGQLAGLEILFDQFTSDLENYFYDELSIPFEIDCEICADYKFREYVEELNPPQPIFLFDLNPLEGESLFVFENRLANLILNREQFLKEKKLTINKKFQVQESNYTQFQSFTAGILEQLQKNWSKLSPVEMKLTRLVSHRIKAKIMNPFDSCIVARVKLTWGKFKTSMHFCFSSIQLDPIMPKISRQALLQASSMGRSRASLENYFQKTLEESSLELKGALGEIETSKRELADCLQSGRVLPISNTIGTKVSIQLNQVPILAGVLGATQDHYSLQVSGEYDEEVKKHKGEAKKEFKQLTFTPFFGKK